MLRTPFFMCTRCSFLGGLAAFAFAPAVASARTGDPQELELAVPRMERVSDTVWFAQLTPRVWIHTTTYLLGGKVYYPANGLIVADGNEAMLIDTGWTNEQTQTILRAWQGAGRPKIGKALVTHFHYDRLGGIPALTQHGIPAFGNPLTIGLAIDNGHAPPRPLHDVEKAPQRFGPVEVFYPGAGHTIDNIVAYVPGDDVLFGGCFIKSVTANDLGNMEDAFVQAWPASVQRVAQRYRARRVVPGHGTISGDSVGHTLTLAKAGR
jgi:metallo-beta-lactamase class B